MRRVPRLRGDDPPSQVPLTDTGQRSLFPAYAGMIRDVQGSSGHGCGPGVPRLRGDDPEEGTNDQHVVLVVFPAYAGMIRLIDTWLRMPRNRLRVPRLRGDDPPEPDEYYQGITATVFPAYAGMIRK